MLQFFVSGQFGGEHWVSVLVSLEICWGLAAGLVKVLLSTSLIRLGVFWGFFSGQLSGRPCFHRFLVMLSFCLYSLCWSNLRSVGSLYSVQIGISQGSLC